MIAKEIDRIKGNPSVKDAYRTGMNALFQAGIVDALRVLGRPKRHRNGESEVVMASEGAWSAGWNDCLETLLYFEQLYFNDDNPAETPNVRMDFGALSKIVESGELTREEADAIRNNTSPKYNAAEYSRNITIPKRTDSV